MRELTIDNCTIYFDAGIAAALFDHEMLMRIAAKLISERYPNASVVADKSFRISHGGIGADARFTLTEELEH